MNKPTRTLLAAALFALVASHAQASDIVPVNFDPAGVGLNDPTAAAPVGGNPGTTVGQQRQIAYQFAADLWGAVLESDVPVYVGASFAPLACTATGGVLGSAGAASVNANFAPGIVPDTWYSAALADSIAGEDLNVGFIDISSRFNANLGTPGCLQASGWYYGLDGNTPAGKINFLNVVMHEIGHGLGFQNFENEAAGTFLNGVPDIYSTFTFDNSTGKRWTQMTVAERQVSALNYGKVVFDGPSVTAGAALLLGPRTAFRVTAPAAIAGDYEYGVAGFGPLVSTSNFTGMVIAGEDDANASGPTTFDGCTAFTNAAAVSGKIALVNRGTCGFTIKVKNAQNAGAIGVIVADNVADNPPPGLGGVDATITIPSIRVTQTAGAAIRAQTGVQVAFVVDPGKLQGADDAGHARLFMPSPVQPGSSGSHYDTALVPNALMEPAITGTLNAALNIDLTPALFQDTGWTLNPGGARIGNCETRVDAVDDGGIIVGANVAAWSGVCATISADKGAYQECMEVKKEEWLASGMLTGRQAGSVMSCAARILK